MSFLINSIPQSRFLCFLYGIFVSCLLSILLAATCYIFKEKHTVFYPSFLYFSVPFIIGLISNFIFSYYREGAMTSARGILYSELCVLISFILVVSVFRIDSYSLAAMIMYSFVPPVLTFAGAILSEKLVGED